MVLDSHAQASAAGIEQGRTQETRPSNRLNSLDIFREQHTVGKVERPNNASATLDFTGTVGTKADDRRELLAQDKTLVADDKPPLRKSELPEYKKYTPEEQAKVAKDLAKQIAEKGFKDSPELRDKIRAEMLRVYLDGDKNSQGDEKKMEAFVKQISDNLPKGMSLRIDQSPDNKDLADFRERAQKAIDKQPGMKMGASGQLQLCKEESGKINVVDKMHYAASVKREPETRKV